MDQNTPESFNNLCSHYKDTYDIHREAIKLRDRLFYGLLFVLALFMLQSSSDGAIAGLVASTVQIYVKKYAGAQLGSNMGIVSTLLWFALFGLSTKYFQTVIEIERQYEYLHSLEDELNSKHYAGSVVFTREGKHYLNKYPLFSNWVHILYTVLFPVSILISAILQFFGEFKEKNQNLPVDFFCFVAIEISVVLYLLKIHKTPTWLVSLGNFLKKTILAII